MHLWATIARNKIPILFSNSPKKKMSDARTELVFAISTVSFACNQVLAMQRSDAAPGVAAGTGPCRGGGGAQWARIPRIRKPRETQTKNLNQPKICTTFGSHL